jgi:glucokinase
MNLQTLGFDVGGTHSRGGVIEWRDGKPVLANQPRTFFNSDHDSFADIVEQFWMGVADKDRIFGMGVGMAGPVVANAGSMTNLSKWPQIAGADLFGIINHPCAVTNDMGMWANACMIATPDQWNQIRPGAVDLNALQPGETFIVGNFGTGVNANIVVRTESGWLILPAEWGHTDFAPVEFSSLHNFLTRLYGRVTKEHALRGSAIKDIYRFGLDGKPAAVDLNADDAPQQLFSLFGTDSNVLNAHLLYALQIGAALGDLALTSPVKAVFLVGSASRILTNKALAQAFNDGFSNKDPMSHLVEPVPTVVLTDPTLALLGSATFAMNHFDPTGAIRADAESIHATGGPGSENYQG